MVTKKAGRRSTSAMARLVRTLGVLVAGLSALGAHAAPRAFVASTGNDANPCTLAQPCRGFTAAIAAADAGGEVVVLDSAGYGPVTIGKSIAIVAPLGVYAGISVASGDGITIDGPGINVALRGLSINGQGGQNGIVFTDGVSLVVERCNIDNLANDGIHIDAPGLVVVSNSIATRNEIGIVVYSNATVAITESTFQFNASAGISLQGPVKATIDHTVVAGNGSVGVYVVMDGVAADVAIDSSSITASFAYGVYVAPFNGSALRVAITRSTIAQNPSGVWVMTAAPAGGTAVVAVTDSDVVDSSGNGITGNGIGTTVRASGNRIMRSGVFGIVSQGGAVIYSPATNYSRDNGIDAAILTADSLL